MRRQRDTLRAIAAYSVLALVLTWPLARGLARDVPGDFGDPLLSAWIVARDADHLERAMAGHLAALRDYWNAAIFAPHPLTLAYSEHMTALALQVLPIHLLSKNPILSYNLLFLSTFIVSAWGMFLLVRDLTGSSAAAFLAGLAFGFAPYRIASIAHLPVLSSAWMPFTLLGFRRFFAGKSRDGYSLPIWSLRAALGWSSGSPNTPPVPCLRCRWPEWDSYRWWPCGTCMSRPAR